MCKNSLLYTQSGQFQINPRVSRTLWKLPESPRTISLTILGIFSNKLLRFVWNNVIFDSTRIPKNQREPRKSLKFVWITTYLENHGVILKSRESVKISKSCRKCFRIRYLLAKNRESEFGKLPNGILQVVGIRFTFVCEKTMKLVVVSLHSFLSLVQLTEENWIQKCSFIKIHCLTFVASEKQRHSFNAASLVPHKN